MILVVHYSSIEKVFCFYAAWIQGYQRNFLLIFRSFDARYYKVNIFIFRKRESKIVKEIHNGTSFI
jgi:hypothetical protein